MRGADEQPLRARDHAVRLLAQAVSHLVARPGFWMLRGTSTSSFCASSQRELVMFEVMPAACIDGLRSSFEPFTHQNDCSPRSVSAPRRRA